MQILRRKSFLVKNKKLTLYDKNKTESLRILTLECIIINIIIFLIVT